MPKKRWKNERTDCNNEVGTNNDGKIHNGDEQNLHETRIVHTGTHPTIVFLQDHEVETDACIKFVPNIRQKGNGDS